MNIGYSKSTDQYFDMDTGQPVNAAAAETSAVEAGLISTGKVMNNAWEGLKRAGNTLVGDDESITAMDAQRVDNEQMYGQLKQAHPVATTVGEMAPYLVSIPISGGLGTMAGLGAIEGAALADPGNTIQGGVLGAGGAALGSMAARVVGRMAQTANKATIDVPGYAGRMRAINESSDVGQEFAENYAKKSASAASQDISDASQRLLSRSDDLGMVSPAGVMKGDATLQLMEAGQRSNPLSGAALRAGQKQNQQALNRHAAKAIGLGDDVNFISSPQLAKAADDIGAGYKAVEDQIGSIKFDDEVLDALSGWESKNLNTILPDKDSIKVFDSLIDNLDAADSLSGRQLMQYRSRIGKAAKKAWRDGDELRGGSMDELVDILDDAVKSQVSGDVGKQWASLGRKWKALKALENRGVDEVTGNVRHRTLATNLRRADKGGFQRGRNRSDFYDAVRYSEMNKDIIGNSGTATRSAAQISQNQLINKGYDMVSDPVGRGLLQMQQNPISPGWGQIGSGVGKAGAGLLSQ